VKIKKGWACVRCENKGVYCANCGGARCVCPEDDRIVVACDHRLDTLFLRVGRCATCKRPFVDGDLFDYQGGAGEVCSKEEGGCPDGVLLES